MDIVGKWSLDPLASDHQDMVLVFLPNGHGVLEIYNWSLCWYETFKYTIRENVITIIGERRYDDNLQTKQLEEVPSQIRYEGKVSMTQGIDVSGKQVDTLEFEQPPAPSYFREKRFSRIIFDVSQYQNPSFEKWRK